MQPTQLSAAALALLENILDGYRAGTIEKQAAIDNIADVFKREPVNYKRAYLDPNQNEFGPQA